MGTAADTLPPTCQINGWRLFGPGAHRDGDPGDTYFPPEIATLAANFAALAAANGGAGGFRPTLKLGHDGRQRAAESLGLGALGRVARLERTADGWLAGSLSGVPTMVGKAVNSGMFPGASVEVYPKALPGPGGKDLPPPTLTGLALLGEERPAVLAVGPPPKAVFADGTEVPPLSADEQRWWLEKMAPYLRAEPAGDGDDPAGSRFEYAGKSYAAISFSAFASAFTRESRPMDPTRDEMTKCLSAHYAADALSAMGDEDMKREYAACKKYAGAAAPAAPAADPTAPPQWFSAFAKKFAGDMEAMGQRLGTVEKFASEVKPAVEGAQLMGAEVTRSRDAAKLARVTKAVDDACGDARRGLPCRLAPVLRDDFIRQGMTKSDALTYSADGKAGRSELDAFEAMLAGLPVLAYSAAAVHDTGRPGAEKPRAGTTPGGRKVLDGLKDAAPAVYARLTARPAAKPAAS